MDHINNDDFLKRTKLYRFYLHHIDILVPIGNHVRNLPCPVARSGHRIIVYKGNVFAFGGYSPRDPITNDIIEQPNNRRLFQELWKFNFASKTWFNLQTSGTMPSEVASHAAVLVDNFILAYGGTGVPFGNSSSNSTHLCNLDTLEWCTLTTTGDKPQRLYGQAIALHNGKMYVIGGTTGFDYTMSVHCLDFHTKVWTRLDNLKKQNYVPLPRYRHEIVVLDNTIFVFGGGTAMDCFDFEKIPTFSLTDNTWSKVSTTTTSVYPEARLCHGSVQIENDVYICGGHDGRTIFSDIWKINLKQLEWKRLNVELPIPLYFHSVAMSEEGQLFIFGGVTNTREEIRTNLILSIWLKIPTLSDMCWQALLSYIPDIAQMDKKDLFLAGVPLKYLEQVDFYAKHQTSR